MKNKLFFELQAWKKRDEGLIAIEMIFSFVAFLLCMSFIVVWIHIAAVQFRTHYALTQTASEIALYAYALEIIGVTDFLRNVDENASGTREGIDTALEGAFGAWDALMGAGESIRTATDLDQDYLTLLESATALSGDLSNAWETGTGNIQQSMTVFQDWANNPKDLFQGLMWIGTQSLAQEGFNSLFGYVMVPAFFERYMGVVQPLPHIDNPQQASHFETVANFNEYLAPLPVDSESFDYIWWTFNPSEGLDGIGSQGAKFLTGPNADELIVSTRYNLRMSDFFRILVIFPEMPVYQQVQARAWVGDGGRFKSDIGTANRGVS